MGREADHRGAEATSCISAPAPRMWLKQNAYYNMENHASPRRTARLSLRCDTPERTRTHRWGANRVYGGWAGHKLDRGGDLQGSLNEGRDRRLHRQGRRDRREGWRGPIADRTRPSV